MMSETPFAVEIWPTKLLAAADHSLFLSWSLIAPAALALSYAVGPCLTPPPPAEVFDFEPITVTASVGTECGRDVARDQHWFQGGLLGLN